MKKILSAIAVLLLLFSSCTKETYQIMSFNIRDGHKDDGTNSWEFRRQACVDFLDSVRPDVFGMQEVVVEADSFIQANLPLYAHVAQGRHPGLWSDESCPLYWRTDKFNLIQSRTFWLSETPDTLSVGWDAKYERIATYVMLESKATAKRLIVFNTHLDHKGATARQESLRLIADTLKALSGDTMALFVMGDMNVEPEDPALIPMYEYMHWSQAEAKKTTDMKTFTGFRHRPDKEKIIDFIFYRNATADRFEVFTDTTRVPFLSDHRPIQAVFSVPVSCTSSKLSRSEQIRQDLLNPNLKRVMVASHRADWRGFPENSLAAIESAIQIGVDIVELDLQETADGELIIMHDETLNRTTTGKGRIDELTLDSIRHFKLKNGVSIRTNHPIPTLREVLVLCKGRVLINLDKADRYFDKVVPLLEETGTTRQIIMKGRKSADEVRELYGRYLDDVIYMPIVDMNDAESVQQFAAHLEAHPCAFELCFRDDDQYVKQASQMAKGQSLIWVNTLWDTLCGGHEDDKAYMESPDDHYGYLINKLGVHIIQTDRPAFLIDYLQKNNLWN